MKNLLFCLVIILGLFACKDSNSPSDKNPTTRILITKDSKIILNYVFNSGTNETIDITHNGETIGTLEVSSYFYEYNNQNQLINDWSFSATIRQPNHYALLNKSIPDYEILDINFDEDFTPLIPNKNCGIVTNYQEISGYGIEKIYFYQPIENGELIDSLTYDEQGYFATDIPVGDYYLSDCANAVYCNTHITLEEYTEFALDLMTVDKPNIYLYPETEEIMDVKLDFHNGGKIVVSDPEYGNGWNKIRVSPDGIINDKHEFLFYEGSKATFGSKDEGWIVERKNLEEFFTKNLTAIGFQGREIDDFIEFWIPVLSTKETYAIYPYFNEDIDEYVSLNISKQPDSVLRLFYVIEEAKENQKLLEPELPEFSREGFSVLEWGVKRKGLPRNFASE